MFLWVIITFPPCGLGRNPALSGIGGAGVKERLALIMEQMKAAEGVTEELKARNQLAWVQHMNSIRSRAEEIIYAELVYV